MKVRPVILPGNKMLRQFENQLNSLLTSWNEAWDIKFQVQKIQKIERKTSLDDKSISGKAFRFEAEEKNDWHVVHVQPEHITGIGTIFLNDLNLKARESKPSRFLQELFLQGVRSLIESIATKGSDSHLVAEGNLKECIGEKFLMNNLFWISIDLLVQDFLVSIHVPWTSIEPHLQSFNQETPGNMEKIDLEKRFNAISNEKVRARAFLGDAELTLSALTSMQVGDVICLDTALDESISLETNQNALKLTGFLGKKENRLAIKIENRSTN